MTSPAALGHAHVAPGGDADLGVDEPGEQRLEGVGGDPHGRIGVHDDVAAQVALRRVLRGRLAAADRHAQQLHTAVREAAHDVVRPVGGRVGHDEDLAAVGRIVDGEERLERGGDGALLVVRGDRDR